MNFDAIGNLLSFLQANPTAWHATQEIGNRLAEQDYTPLDEQEKWRLIPDSPQFSMHAAREVIAINDHHNLCKLLKSILEA